MTASPAPLRLGLIGAGPWGRRYIETLKRLEGARLTRVASRNPETASLVGAACAVSADWRKLVAAGDLDGVIVASPPALHAEMARAALSAGLPALIEKPLTLKPLQAKDLLALAEARRGFVLVDHIYLYHPAYRALKERAGALGGVLRIESTGGNRGPYRTDTPPLWDYGPHDLALCLDLLGAGPSSIEASSRKAGPGEVLELKLSFPGGVQAALSVGNGMEAKARRFRVDCARGTLDFDDLRADKLLESRAGTPPAPVPVSSELPLDRALGEFISGIRARSRDLESLRLAVDVVETLARCETSLTRAAS